MKKVVIVSGVPIYANPRAKKEADVLCNAGYDVEVIGAIYDAESGKIIHELVKDVNWMHIPVVDLSKASTIEYWKFQFARIRLKFWKVIKKIFHVENYGLLGYFPHEIYKLAKARKADLYILHAEESLWAGSKLLKDGFKVAVDIEDWYSEDGLPEDRESRPIKIMKECESLLLTKSVFSVTTSKELSQALSQSYQCLPPEVIYNSFPNDSTNSKDHDKRDRKDVCVPSITWFSLTIGPGRGLEQLVEALNSVQYPFELHIRGLARDGYCGSLLEMANDRSKKSIFFHSQEPQSKLLFRLKEHDIGYCGELSDCSSRDLTITNKMMEYLNAGLVVLATNTRGQKEVAKNIPKGVFLFEQNDVSSLSKLLDKILGDPGFILESKKQSILGFESHYNWGASANILRQLTSKALSL